MRRHRAVACESGQHLFVAQVLRPRLELFRRRADLFAKLDQSVPDRVGFEIRQARTLEPLAENAADRDDCPLSYSSRYES